MERTVHRNTSHRAAMLARTEGARELTDRSDVSDEATREMPEDEDAEETQRTLLQKRGESGKKLHGLEESISRKPPGRCGSTR